MNPPPMTRRGTCWLWRVRSARPLPGRARTCGPACGPCRNHNRSGVSGACSTTGGGAACSIAAPALSAIVAAVIAVGVIGGRSGDEGTIAVTPTASRAEALQKAVTTPSSTSATPPAAASPAIPDATAATAADAGLSAPITLRVASDTLEARIADIRRLVVAAGGTVGLAPPQVAPPGAVVSITLPAERSADVLGAIANLGTGRRYADWAAYLVTPPAAGGAAAASGALTSVRVLVTEGP